MRNPEATKEKILKKSGILFNTQGYKSTSISNITDATGFTKGAIYKHFSNKTELEQQTMAYLSGLLFSKMRDMIRNEKTAGDKLRSIFSFFETYISNPPLKGGCPLLNAAIEADDSHPSLRKEALKTLTTLRQSVVYILEKGIEHKQIKADIDTDFYASLIIAGLEGSVMMSKLEGNNTDILRMITHLNKQLTEIEI
jgi:TetR/AcrR family transcriptional regulator, transcriptional repressor for nem operon